MPVNFEPYVGIHAQALQVRSKRTELLAQNMANADTPNYKAKDIDFRAALAQAGGSNATLNMTATNRAHLSAGESVGGANVQEKYRVPLAPSLDGNTVDPQLEQAAFADNVVRYQATLTFLSSKFKNLMTAITGQ
jgi:flagellar basal-body rod protein FlgB